MIRQAALLITALSLAGCGSFTNDENVRLQYSQMQHVHAIHQDIRDSLASRTGDDGAKTNDMQRMVVHVPERVVNGVVIKAHDVFVPIEEGPTKLESTK